jgi:hypothetical protein
MMKIFPEKLIVTQQIKKILYFVEPSGSSHRPAVRFYAVPPDCSPYPTPLGFKLMLSYHLRLGLTTSFFLRDF